MSAWLPQAGFGGISAEISRGGADNPRQSKIGTKKPGMGFLPYPV